MNWRRLFEFAGFQVVWIICALGSANGQSWPAVLATLAFLVLLIATGRPPRMFLGLALASAVTGAVVESAFAASGLMAYQASWPSTALAPVWIVALWAAFGATLPTTADLLGNRPWGKAALLGAVFGPLSYVAGEKLGAVAITASPLLAFGVIAIAWAGIYPALIALARRAVPDA